MSELREMMSRARLQITRDLIFSLHTQATLVQDYSDDEDNPNVSAYLRSGATEEVLKLEEAAFAAGEAAGRFR